MQLDALGQGKGNAHACILTPIIAVAPCVVAGANMGEYAPTALILMFLMETQAKLSRDNLIAFGTALVAARILHAIALSTSSLPAWRSAHTPLRALGFLTTIGLIAGAGVFLVRWSMKSMKQL